MARLQAALRERADEAGSVSIRSAAPSGTAAFASSIGAFKAGFNEMAAASLAKFMMALDPSGKKADPLQAALKPVLDTIIRSTMLLAEALSEADIDANRKALKAQDMMHKMKVEASRTASGVQMQNQAAEMQASYNTQLAAKVEMMQSGSSATLREALERAEELTQELANTTKELTKTEDLNKSLRALMRSKENEAKEADDEAQRMRNEVQEVERTVSVLTSGKDTEIKKLRASLQEAAAEVERASIQSAAECKRQVEIISKRLNQELNAQQRGVREAQDAQFQRLLSELGTMSRTLAEVETEAQSERAAMTQKVDAAQSEAAEARRKLDEFWDATSTAGSGVPDIRGSLEAAQNKAKNLSEELADTRMKVELQEAETAKRVAEVDGVRREMAEQMTRMHAEAQRATFQSADECKRQVEGIAKRLRFELDQAKKHEREHSQDQLDRLLGEITALNRQLGSTEAKLRDAEEKVKACDSLVIRLKQLEAQERTTRDALTSALGDLAGKSFSNLKLNEQLGRLLAHYKQMKNDCMVLKSMLDKSLKDVAITVGDNVSLHDKLNQLLDQYRQQQEEARQLRITLDRALQDITSTVGENANLSDKLRQLLAEYRKSSENELQLRAALKRQSVSLNSAYHRVKDVELELTRSNTAGAEQRDSLVNASLIALQQLRGRLGAVYALRQDATKPVEEALVVRKMHQSGSAPSLVHQLGHSTMQGAHFDAFMDRIADVVGVPHHPDVPQRPFAPASPLWSVASSRPTPDSAKLLSPMPMPRVPRPGARPLSFEAARLSR